jgi:hypothetical protein
MFFFCFYNFWSPFFFVFHVSCVADFFLLKLAANWQAYTTLKTLQQRLLWMSLQFILSFVPYVGYLLNTHTERRNLRLCIDGNGLWFIGCYIFVLDCSNLGKKILSLADHDMQFFELLDGVRNSFATFCLLLRVSNPVVFLLHWYR